MEIFMSSADPSGHFAPVHPPLAALSNNDRKRSANSFPMSLWAKIKKKTQGLAEAAHGTGATLSWELR